MTSAGQDDPLFEGLPQRQKCLQWHSVQVAQPPENAVVLASSLNCRVQSMRVRSNAWSLQYHVELEADTIENWAGVPAYKDALVASLGEAGLEQMKSMVTTNMADFTACVRTLYRNFMKHAKQTITS